MPEPSPKKVGRPSKFTEDNVKLYLEHIRNGVPQSIASAAIGVHEMTIIRWRHQGEEYGALDRELTAEEQRYVNFTEAVVKARADALAEKIAQVDLAGHTDWRASAWYLERQLPKEFGQVSRTELTGSIELSQAQIVSEAQRIVQQFATRGQIEDGE